MQRLLAPRSGRARIRPMRRALLIALGAATVAVACGRTGFDLGGGGGLVPTDFGDGADGPLDVASAMVVNTCSRITAASGRSLALESTAGFRAGRQALVLQVQDFGATSGDATPVTAPGLAGRWQVQRVDEVAGGVIRVHDAPLAFVLGSGARAQACTMPEFSSVSIGVGEAIVAQPWEGSSGGVVAFFASEELSIDGAIVAHGAGFRGGVQENDNGDRHVTDLDLPLAGARGGGKGEGLDPGSWRQAGRGNWWNAGGGGNAHNAGGGGGGGAGEGGEGGLENPDGFFVDNETKGMPGARMDYDPRQRLLFGGGGGAGQRNQGTDGHGGRGGGVVLVFARAVRGSGAFLASGADAPDIPQPLNDDGSGGGGGGGTIFVRALLGSAFDGSFVLSGGAGGDTEGDHGPGGGGGGGLALVEGGFTSFTTQTNGGPSGTALNRGPREADPGIAGVVSRE